MSISSVTVSSFSNIARIANAVQVATFYSEDKIDKKDLSTDR